MNSADRWGFQKGQNKFIYRIRRNKRPRGAYNYANDVLVLKSLIASKNREFFFSSLKNAQKGGGGGGAYYVEYGKPNFFSQSYFQLIGGVSLWARF